MSAETARPKILIVDDEKGFCLQMRWALAQEYDVLIAQTTAEAKRILKRENPPVILLDVSLTPGTKESYEGIELLTELMQEDPYRKVIMLTGNDSRENSMEAIVQGA